MFTKLKCLMEPKELHPLKPLLLLLGWTHCYSCTEGRELLQTLWTDKVRADEFCLTFKIQQYSKKKTGKQGRLVG